MKNAIIKRLNIVNENIEKYKKMTIEEIEKEQIVPATNDLLMISDLKEQQGILNKMLEVEKENERRETDM